MQHGDFRVKILNDAGQVVGFKLRKEIDKARDIVHCANVFVINNGQFLLTKLPASGLYPGKLGSAPATMVREGEEAIAAADRAMKKELGVDEAKLELLGEDFFTYDDGVKRLKTTFLCRYDGEVRPNPEDVPEIVMMSVDEIRQAIDEHPETFAPTFLGLWNKYANNFL